MERFITSYFSKPQNDDCGYFILELVYTKQEIERKVDLQDSVKREFENEFKNYRIMIQHVNSEVNSYNSSIKKFAEELLIKRKKSFFICFIKSEIRNSDEAKFQCTKYEADFFNKDKQKTSSKTVVKAFARRLLYK